jgi:hypothetical protein
LKRPVARLTADRRVYSDNLREIIYEFNWLEIQWWVFVAVVMNVWLS